MYEKIVAAYPELSVQEFINGTIILRDDSDGAGQYLAEWNYSKPIPKGIKLGK